MNKIPVLATIRAAYGFVFEHLGAIIGLIWLPKVVSTMLSFFVQERYYSALTDAVAAHSPASAGPAMLAILFSGLANVLLYAMMVVPVTELALGTRQGGAMVHVAFGAAEWRLFRSFIALVLLLAIPFSLILMLAGLAQQAPASPAGLAGTGGVLLLEAVVLFLVLRFGFLLAPAAAAGGDGNVLARSWSLSAGNFWRIMLVVFGAVGPLLVVNLGAEAALLGPSAILPQFHANPESAAAQMALMRGKMPLVMGIDFLLAPFFLGLALGAGAFAWRSLTGARDLAPAA